MPSACCGDGQFCDFPWCDCTGNAQFREAHKLVNPSDKEQDCGKPHCNYCNQTVRRERASGVALPDGGQTV
jgi:hypothetical protein